MLLRRTQHERFAVVELEYSHSHFCGRRPRISLQTTLCHLAMQNRPSHHISIADDLLTDWRGLLSFHGSATYQSCSSFRSSSSILKPLRLSKSQSSNWNPNSIKASPRLVWARLSNPSPAQTMYSYHVKGVRKLAIPTEKWKESGRRTLRKWS